ncbi:HPr family phosphocarrier protein [uncultured Marinococcus sp.]|uniref:HPr family phosphocarrier protein n=1 Tax=uncultured Marinococcus sp. TaxID=487012 RepID=UPI0026225D82|nr:HPr family phosphocarrier protein [uncultured Marinococcus sp.]
MKQHSVRINLEEGLQARNTTALVRHALGYDCDIMVGKEDRWVDGKSLMGMMNLHGRKHEWLTLVTDGKEEATAMDALTAFLTTASSPKTGYSGSS